MLRVKRLRCVRCDAAALRVTSSEPYQQWRRQYATCRRCGRKHVIYID